MCNYVFSKGKKSGKQCKTKPRFGNYCSKHKKWSILKNKKSDICTICIEIINKNKKITKCNHLFHSKCLDKWLTIGNTCPLCRTELIEKQTYHNHDDEYSLDEDDISSEEFFNVLPNYLRNVTIKTDWERVLIFTDSIDSIDTTTMVIPKILLTYDQDDEDSIDYDEDSIDLSRTLNLTHNIQKEMVDMCIDALDALTIDFLCQENEDYELPLQVLHHINYK
jgi:hypothetical protein